MVGFLCTGHESVIYDFNFKGFFFSLDMFLPNDSVAAVKRVNFNPAVVSELKQLLSSKTSLEMRTMQVIQGSCESVRLNNVALIRHLQCMPLEENINSTRVFTYIDKIYTIYSSGNHFKFFSFFQNLLL